MPSSSAAGPLGPWQLLALAFLVAAAAACTAYLARKHQASDGGLPDAVFWDGFGGLAVVAPAVLLPAVVSPWAGVMLSAVALTTAAAGYRWTPALFRWQASRRAARDAAAAGADAAVRHRAALARWRRYELDPAACIDFPAMSDPCQPETAEMLRAMKAAEELRGRSSRDTRAAAGYSAAVERLERALAEAERAAGAPDVSAAGISR